MFVSAGGSRLQSSHVESNHYRFLDSLITKEPDLMSAGAPRLRATQILGITFALTNLLLWFSVPAIRAFVDERTGRWADPNNPMILNGVQELFLYGSPAPYSRSSTRWG